MQNAADCNSSYFAIHYDTNYFMVINNGEPFSHEGIKAILNFTQSNKVGDHKQIGNFGMGFKLIHRLVGKNDGIEEVKYKNKGPIMFSWNNHTQLINFTENSEILVEEKSYKNISDFSNDTPWLQKIVLTCFPCGLEESVKNLHFKDEVLFKNEELQKFINFFNSRVEKNDIGKLKQGSIFFWN